MTQNERHLLKIFEDELYCIRLGLSANTKLLVERLGKAEQTCKELYAILDKQPTEAIKAKILEFRPPSTEAGKLNRQA